MFGILWVMKGATQGGFTIVEVMMVLAISATMLFSAATVFRGSREDTLFTQSVYDLRSELQSLANDVSSQNVPGMQNYKCTATNIGGVMRPVLSAGTSTGQDCIYLGQAIQVAPDATTLYSYPVFGTRTVYTGTADTGVPPTTVSDSHPEAATTTASPTLTTTYGLLNGLKVVSAKVGANNDNILTMYSSLSDSNTSGNELNLNAYNYTAASTDPATQIKDCVEGSNCTAEINTLTSTPWNLCVQYSSKQALVSLKAAPTGISIQLNLNGCS